MSTYQVTNSLVIAYLDNGAPIYLYQHAILPDNLRSGEVSRLLALGWVALLEEGGGGGGGGGGGASGGGVDPRPALFILDGFIPITDEGDVPFPLAASPQRDEGTAPTWIAADADGNLLVAADGLYQVNWSYEIYLTADTEVTGQFRAALSNNGDNLTPVVKAPPFTIPAAGYVEVGAAGSWVASLVIGDVLAPLVHLDVTSGQLSAGDSDSGTNSAAVSITKLS